MLCMFSSLLSREAVCWHARFNVELRWQSKLASVSHTLRNLVCRWLLRAWVPIPFVVGFFDNLRVWQMSSILIWKVFQSTVFRVCVFLFFFLVYMLVIAFITSKSSNFLRLSLRFYNSFRVTRSSKFLEFFKKLSKRLGNILTENFLKLKF